MDPSTQSDHDTILVVDDDVRSREIVSAYLRPSYRVLEADNGALALEMVAAAGVDLLVLDVMMPGIDGIDTCREVKLRTHDEFLPVLLLTALSDQEHRNLGLAAHADDFLTKPVDRSELLLRVRAFLNRRATSRRRLGLRIAATGSQSAAAYLERLRSDLSEPSVLLSTLLIRFRPALILMDLAMPRLDGFAAKRALMQHSETASIPVVALTANAMQASEARASAEGFAAYITKPFESAALQQTVATLVEVGHGRG